MYCINCEESDHAASYCGCLFLKIAKYVKNRDVTTRQNSRHANLSESGHPASDPETRNTSIDSKMADMETRIVKAIQGLLTDLMTTVKENAARVNFLFENSRL